MRRLLPLLLTPLLLWPATTMGATPPPEVGTTMTFGAGLGAIKPFVPAKEVRRLLGKPNKTVRANGALAWLDYGRKYGLTVFFKTNSPDSGVFSVKAYRRGYSTAEGVAVGDPAAKVLTTYPDSTCGTDLQAIKGRKARCSVGSISSENGYEYSSEVIIGRRGRVKALAVGLLF